MNARPPGSVTMTAPKLSGSQTGWLALSSGPVRDPGGGSPCDHNPGRIVLVTQHPAERELAHRIRSHRAALALAEQADAWKSLSVHVTETRTRLDEAEQCLHIVRTVLQRADLEDGVE